MGENVCLEVTSEIYTETNFRSSKSKNGSASTINTFSRRCILNCVFFVVLVTISDFTFFYPNNHTDDNGIHKSGQEKSIIDKDGDLIVERRQRGVIQIEHQQSTNLSLVGLQVWRAALILADFLFHNRCNFSSKRLLELGAGVGLSSIAAGIHSKTDIVCTDIDKGGILEVVKSNVDLNQSIINSAAKLHVMELDFKKTEWPDELKNAAIESDIVIAADGKPNLSLDSQFDKHQYSLIFEYLLFF